MGKYVICQVGDERELSESKVVSYIYSHIWIIFNQMFMDNSVMLSAINKDDDAYYSGDEAKNIH